MFTHFACADEPGDMTTEQYQRFKDMVNEAIKPEYIHCQNSAGSLLMDCQFCKCNKTRNFPLWILSIRVCTAKVKVHLKPSVQLIANVVQNKDATSG